MSTLGTQGPTSSSQSPTRRSLGEKISALGARLTRTLSHTDENREEEDRYSLDSPPSYYQNERSTSRGREVFSTGRGGLGNIRQASLSRDRPDTGPDDFSAPRGREPIATAALAAHQQQVFSTGRGGAGNLRSPSRDPAGPDPAELDVVREYAVAHADAPASSGRGGLGNISHSRSRSRPPPVVHSTGRGGAGNILPGDGHLPDVIDADARRHVLPHEGPHSTGRGGRANISTLHEPPVEHHAHPPAHFESTGRGGVGNIHSERERSKSKTRA